MMKHAPAALVAAVLAILPGMSGAQTPGPVATPVPVEIVISAPEQPTFCSPPTVQLPAMTPVVLSLINRSDRAIAFRADMFFEHARVTHLESAVRENMGRGIQIAPRVTAKVSLSTPEPGSYDYACAQPEHGAPQSRGTIVVAPPAG